MMTLCMSEDECAGDQAWWCQYIPARDCHDFGVVCCQTCANYRQKVSNAVTTCEIELFQNHLSLRRRPSEIILKIRQILLKIFQNLKKIISKFSAFVDVRLK